MKTFAFCARSFAGSVRRAAGVEPLTSPPVLMRLLDVDLLGGYDFYYFKLHGLPDQPFWYGDGWATAVSRDQLMEVDWSGATVFVANCHGLDQFGRPEVMTQAILDGGARAVVAGSGVNYAAADELRGADWLGLYFRSALRMTVHPLKAFSLARSVLDRLYPAVRMGRMTEDEQKAVNDALRFKIFVRGM